MNKTNKWRKLQSGCKEIWFVLKKDCEMKIDRMQSAEFDRSIEQTMLVYNDSSNNNSLTLFNL